MSAWVEKTFTFLFEHHSTPIDFLPALKSGDSFCKRLKSQTGNVLCGIDVSVMHRSAFAARPLPYSKSGSTFRTAGRDNSTAQARLG
jgi:hypothetical protein